MTVAIAEAVTTDEVHEAIVDRVAASIGASSAGLWLVRGTRAIGDDSEPAAEGEAWGELELVRSTGYSERARELVSTLSLSEARRFPVIDCARSVAALFHPTRAALLADYPRMEDVITPGRAYSTACLPILVEGRARGVLAFTFEGDESAASARDPEHEAFVVLVARYAGLALERLRLAERERSARERSELLHALAASVIRAQDVDHVFAAALPILEQALGTTRSAILAFDAKRVMRFRAWRGLGDAYRAAVDGHSPWPADVRSPKPIVIADAAADTSLAPHADALEREGIRALAFVPLVSGDELIGKFMVYYDRPRALSAAEIAAAETIADHLSAAIQRFAAVDELQRTVQFNELFTGMLGHDLRNPLASIIAAAQLATMRAAPDERITKPLGRIVAGSQRIARMIDQLVDLTHLRMREGIEVVPAPTDLVVLLRKVVDEAEPGRVRLVVRAADEDDRGAVIGAWDESRIRQVFTNLVSNAIRHAAPGLPDRPGEPGPDVTVTVDDTAPEGVSVTVHNPGVIHTDALPTLFEPVVRRAKHDRQGLGLGLYINKEIVCAHRGVLTVTTDEELGTTFTVLLPR